MLSKIYQQMFLIRSVEEKLLSLFTQGKIKGTVHTCIGQEACAVGSMMAAELEKDLVFSNHRGHGHLLAYGIPLDKFLGELMGKICGPSRGLGGSQHMLWKNFMTSGIQGSLLPIGVGAAFAEKKKKSDAISIIFMGDGTMGQGIVYESFNFAAKWKIPVAFILENNGYAQTTKTCHAHAGDISMRAAAFNIPCSSIDGNNVELVHDHLVKSYSRIRTSNSPELIELRTNRLCAHSKGDDTRPEEELAEYWKNDPLNNVAFKLPKEKIDSLQAEIINMVESTVKKVLQAPSLSYETYKEKGL